MDQNQTIRQTCPACGSRDYLFRGRKIISSKPGQEETMETKYRCKACEHVWSVQRPGKETK
jgi:DNA-directed RNA polymerase subunit M/transcription elongation factor TFIIS